jgi:hypothetical protein
VRVVDGALANLLEWVSLLLVEDDDLFQRLRVTHPNAP